MGGGLGRKEARCKGTGTRVKEWAALGAILEMINEKQGGTDLAWEKEKGATGPRTLNMKEQQQCQE